MRPESPYTSGVLRWLQSHSGRIARLSDGCEPRQAFARRGERLVGESRSFDLDGVTVWPFGLLGLGNRHGQLAVLLARHDVLEINGPGSVIVRTSSPS